MQFSPSRCCDIIVPIEVIPPIIDFMEKRPSSTAAIVLVFSPLNALIRTRLSSLERVE